jgi:thiol-disulfide isomerase/thioredoxin
MYQSSKLLFNLCLTSLVTSISFVTTTTASHANPHHPQSHIQLAQANKNPCAGQDPCASKLGSVGGALAKQLHGKPVLVEIYASWCPACQNIEPTLSQLKQQYGDRVHFIVLDVSNKAAAKKSEAKAQQLGLGKYFAANKSKTGTVTIVEPTTGNILAQEINNANKSAYSQVLDTQLAQK